MDRARLLGLVTAFSLLATSPALGQRGAAFVGVSGGATLSDLKGGSMDTETRWGGTAGVMFGYRTTDATLISVEANWIQKGGGEVRLDYIEVPLLVGAGFRTDNGMGVRVYGGIGAAFKIGCSSDSVLLDCDRTQAPEWSIPVGVTFTRLLASGKFIGLDIRYTAPISDAFETSIAKNRTWVFKVVFGLPIRKGG